MMRPMVSVTLVRKGLQSKTTIIVVDEVVDEATATAMAAADVAAVVATDRTQG